VPIFLKKKRDFTTSVSRKMYGTAESRTFYGTPVGYTAEKKTRRKRNRG
jgi:hypothetical protein